MSAGRAADAPRISFLVSACDRPRCLWASLGSLVAQTLPELEAIVLCNSPDDRLQAEHAAIVQAFADSRLRCVNSWHDAPGSWDCYHAADWAVAEGLAAGEFVCCASDDSYYCPEFAASLCAAAETQNLDLVYCDLLYDARLGGKRTVLPGLPEVDHIDKTNFIVRRRRWIGFPTKIVGPEACISWADGEAVEAMLARGYRHARVPEVLVVHN